ncbi:CHAD domain-containing protein [Chelatococcus sambhunathii]|uniref:CHAD domain-containing protein n=1 Tax=Chelatococcus sambhunathii TaxID=363953 RepID=A0ABU1DFY7_9HYPH|nr:CHAD domain-containing protein [Chelatococcus sambhunathii]MDR4307014.1 CHAD domain-containing protein [Chelatococcus sambhunathii]
MAAPTEIELKLECDPAALEGLRAHPRLVDSKRRPLAKLRTVYFDAADLRLRQAGVTLRVRTFRSRHTQTVKAVGDGLLERPEWEGRVLGPEPDIGLLGETPVPALLADGAAVAPLFTVDVHRRTFLVTEGASEIEVALDAGRIFLDDGRTAPISELELELKSGDLADVFSLAAALGETADLRLGVRSKSERGFRLLDGAQDTPCHAEKISLSKEASTADAFRAVVNDCLRQIRLNEAILLRGPDAEALHQLRVGVRRLRSAFSLFGRVVKTPAGLALFAELKSLSEPFGQGRNLDVFLAETLPQERERRPEEPGFAGVERQIAMERDEAHQAVASRLRSAEWRKLVLAILAWVHAGDWLAPQDAKIERALRGPARKFAGKALDKRLRQAKQGHDLARLSVEERHKIRIAAKKLRYGAEFFGSLYTSEKKSARLKKFVKALKRLQGKLGSLNDIAAASELMSDAAANRLEDRSSLFAAGLTAGGLQAGSSDLLAEAREAYDKLIDLRPFWR